MKKQRVLYLEQIVLTIVLCCLLTVTVWVHAYGTVCITTVKKLSNVNLILP